jgi:hypothetical protein
VRWRGIPKLKVGASIFCVIAGAFAYGNWKGSALHHYVCGSDAPFDENMMWILYGERVIDNLPARLCGCEPPPGYAEYKAKVGFHWVNGRLEYTPTAEDYPAIQLGLSERRAEETTDTAPSTAKTK